jgi:hypothetical protein
MTRVWALGKGHSWPRLDHHGRVDWGRGARGGEAAGGVWVWWVQQDKKRIDRLIRTTVSL